uniref:probable inactive ATP-dependent zinc metalloprotease FTSHI 3, chloroplastic n=1 Tax=Erigeron canadensis TaxID=72917 RepID=UPI001CB92C58|nr:probable inactive ATP-dependent zinc metalloprotease FTSHI 3, chloroplastic [Erigeron canadensis]
MKDVGEDKGSRVMSNLFIEARGSSPSIIYLADIQDIASTPSNKIFATLLAEMKQSEKEGCALAVVASSTIDPELLDATLIKSRNFLMNVEMGKLDEEARKKYIDFYLTPFLMEEQRDEIRSLIVSRTKNFRKRDFKYLAKLSKKWADKRCSPRVTKEHVIASFPQVYKASGLQDESK